MRVLHNYALKQLLFRSANVDTESDSIFLSLKPLNFVYSNSQLQRRTLNVIKTAHLTNIESAQLPRTVLLWSYRGNFKCF